MGYTLKSDGPECHPGSHSGPEASLTLPAGPIQFGPVFKDAPVWKVGASLGTLTTHRNVSP